MILETVQEIISNWPSFIFSFVPVPEAGTNYSVIPVLGRLQGATLGKHKGPGLWGPFWPCLPFTSFSFLKDRHPMLNRYIFFKSLSSPLLLGGAHSSRCWKLTDGVVKRGVAQCLICGCGSNHLHDLICGSEMDREETKAAAESCVLWV